MPITRRYGQSVLPQLAMLAGEAQAEQTGMQMDQQLAQQAMQRQQESQRLRFQNQLQQAKQAQQQRRGSGTMPNRARVIYPNRTATTGSSPLQQQVQKAAAKFQQRQEAEAEPIQNESGGLIFPQSQQPEQGPSPYGDQGPASTATLRTGNGRSFTVEDQEIVTREDGTVTGRTPTARGPEQALSRRGQSKLAALESIGASDLLNERQLTAVQQMAADDEIDLQEFRQWLGQAVRSAEAQRERAAEQGQAAGGPASMAHPSQRWQAQYSSTEKRARQAASEAEELRQLAEPPRPDMTEDEFRQWLDENVTDEDRSNWPFYLGSTGRHRETIIDQRLKAFRQFKQKAQDAAKAEQQRQRLLGQTDRGGEVPERLQTPDGQTVSRQDVLDTARNRNISPRQVIEDLGLQPVE